MAFRLTGYWRRVLNGLRGSASYVTATSRSTKACTPIENRFRNSLREELRMSKLKQKGDFVPVYVALGMVGLSTMLGLHTAKQQLLYSPSVRVKKKLRETIPEVVYPEKVVDESSKFVGKSVFRKAAHVQESGAGLKSISKPKDISTRPPKAETLKSVGIDPKTDF